jgi:phosphatidate phosphatase APP1
VDVVDDGDVDDGGAEEGRVDEGTAEEDEGGDGGGRSIVSRITSPITSPLSRVVRSEKTAGMVASAEDAVWRLRRERKLGKGTLRATHAVGYRGYVAEGRAYVRLRITEEPVIPKPAEALSEVEIVRTNLRRFAALAFPGVKVKVSLAGSEDRVETDRHGYAAGAMEVGDLPPGWHDYNVATEPDDPQEEPAEATGRVLVPDPTAKVWVVSDIDDTVLQTGLAEGLVAVKNTLLGQAHTRQAVPGMSTLYRALEAGRPGDGRTAFFYLSTGPWSLYAVLTEFLKVRGFPDGPLFLTVWGPQERYITRSGSEHKRQALRKLAANYPGRRFVLIGDSGQRDPYNYADFAREYPDSVAAIVIVDVGLAEHAEEVAAHSELAVAEGLPFYFVADAREAAIKLCELELITEESIEAVNKAFERG